MMSSPRLLHLCSRTHRGKQLLPVTGGSPAPAAGGKGGHYGQRGDLNGTQSLRAVPRAQSPHQWHGTASPAPHGCLLKLKVTWLELPVLPKILDSQESRLKGFLQQLNAQKNHFLPQGPSQRQSLNSTSRDESYDLGQVVLPL